MTLSIITINYNNAEGLKKTIESVVNQTYQDFEYIIIDGGSTDNSVSVIQEYSNRIDYWISEPDKGIYNAMNKGIKKAKGKYIHFLNSADSYVSPNTLKNIFFNKTYTIPLIRGNQIQDDKEGSAKWSNFGNRDITLYDLYTHTIQHQATFMHHDLFEKYGLYDESYKIVSDWAFFLKIIFAGEQSIYLDEDVILFDMNGISTNKDWEEYMLKEREDVLSKLIPQTIRTDYDKLVELEKKINFSQHYYISNFVLAHKLPRFIFNILNKTYSLLKLQ